MTTRFIDHLLTGTHAARPAANTVPDGTLYSCTTHTLVYQSASGTWGTWLTAGGSVAALDDVGDVTITSVADGDVLTYDSGSGDWVNAAPSGGGGSNIYNDPNFTDSAETGWTQFGSNIVTADMDTTRAGHAYLEVDPPNTTTLEVVGWYRSWSPSAGDYIKAFVRSHNIIAATQEVGVFACDTASGKTIGWHIYGQNGTPNPSFHWRTWSSFTTGVNDANTTVVPGASPLNRFGGFWLKLIWNSNTDYDMQYSLDGETYIELVTAKAPDSAFTANAAGIMVNPHGSSSPLIGVFGQWELT